MGVSNLSVPQFRIVIDTTDNALIRARVDKKKLSDYGLNTVSAAITDEEHHNDFEKLMSETRKKQALTLEKRQDIEYQIAVQQFNEEDGEAKKIKKRKELEAAELEKVIAANTKVEEQKKLFEASKHQLAAARNLSEANRLMNSGGIDPVVRLDMELKNKVQIAKALAGDGGLLNGLKFYNSGSGQGSSNNDVIQQLILTTLLDKQK